MTETNPTAAHEQYQRELRLFANEDEIKAAEAFAKLCERVQDRLTGYLRRFGFSHADCEDISVATFLKIWNARRSFEPKGPGAWWCFVRKVARNCAADEAKGRTLTADLDEIGEVPDADLPYLDILVLAAEDRRRFYDLADRLWLGIAESEAESALNLLAAQLFYIHEMGWPDITELLQMRREELDRLLTDSAVVRHLGYQELYWDNDRLISYVIRPEDPIPADEVRSAIRRMRNGAEIEPPDGWTWMEILVVVWRLGNGLLTEQILRFEGCELSRAELELLFDRFRTQFPFRAIASKLVESLARAGQEAHLVDMSLWKRLIFQYHCAEELPQRQILERINPASEVVGVTVSDSTVNVWVSAGRLYGQLAAFAAKEAA